MGMTLRFQLNVLMEAGRSSMQDVADCSVDGCGIHDEEELTQCVECGANFCKRLECPCPVYDDDAAGPLSLLESHNGAGDLAPVLFLLCLHPMIHFRHYDGTHSTIFLVSCKD